MTEKLQNQVNGSEWSWKNLNTVGGIFPPMCKCPRIAVVLGGRIDQRRDDGRGREALSRDGDSRYVLDAIIIDEST